MTRPRLYPQMTDAQFYCCIEKRATRGYTLDAAYEVLTQGATVPEVMRRYRAKGLKVFSLRARLNRTLARFNAIKEAFCNGPDNR